MSAPTSAASKRKHVTTACVACRESKVRCDGVSPACSSCRNKGKECRYQASDDKRKLSSRVAIELLSSRIDQLCQFILENSLQPPPMEEEAEATLTKVLANLRLTSAFAGNDSWNKAGSDRSTPPSESLSRSEGKMRHRANSAVTVTNPTISSEPVESSNPSRTSPENPIAPSLHHLDWNWNLSEDMPMNLQMAQPTETNSLEEMLLDTTVSLKQPLQGVMQPGCSPQLKENAGDTEGTEELVEKLSARMGSLQIGPGGQVRYYGPTSNFNLVDMPAPDNLTVHRTVRNNGQEHLDRLGIGKEVPRELEDHLVDLYFTWQGPALHVVNRAMYEEAKIRWQEGEEDTPYYSEALRNSICSLGAAFETRHHPTFVTFPKSLSDFFADRAKALLEIELDSPCVATVQAMVVLSGHDIGCKRDARGWLYSGMAMRLAFDLALHVDMSSYVSRGSLSQSEADLRRTVFWGAYTADYTWGLYLGRPFRINMEDVTIEKPGGNPATETATQWIPYGSPKSLDDCTPCVDYPEELSRYRAMMCEIMAPLVYALYGSLNIKPEELYELNTKTIKELLNWKENLPGVLQVDPNEQDRPYLPHVLLLHMQYYQNIIYAHRPWMSRRYSQSLAPHALDWGYARMMCIESATAIAKLLQHYESRYTLRRMNIQGVGITCSAALLLLFTAVTNYRLPGDDVEFLLSSCFRALDEFGAAWENAKRARDFLVLLQRQWESRARASRARRPSQSSTSISRKRARTSSHGSILGSSSISYPETTQPLPRPGFQAGNYSTNMTMGFDLDWMPPGDAYATTH
ncbi:fungal-specific transcription factor domain-containing protein [Annulohypoxylon truncatum]|uniref:fungal-specific transcription factor domain-containing protein n=1 Tax=Annulohypoxylon truncatum TaxID=327061 RepID=UPI00200789D1|nr:fungal-specific transcription factor domain-containing protein [Annulohypoxylon truncatum]KAI1213739.1 fungal-specific transcription factor domain-containing protein [Annulohypoxylon truncatum]